MYVLGMVALIPLPKTVHLTCVCARLLLTASHFMPFHHYTRNTWAPLVCVVAVAAELVAKPRNSLVDRE